jgi:hypothetical protein
MARAAFSFALLVLIATAEVAPAPPAPTTVSLTPSGDAASAAAAAPALPSAGAALESASLHAAPPPAAADAADAATAAAADPPPPFVATDEWQRVLDGQAVPPGLHVKLDLSGGGRWAKLLPPHERGRAFGADASAAAVAVGAQGGVVAVADARAAADDVAAVDDGVAAAAPAAAPAVPATPSETLLAALDASAAEKARVLLTLPEPVAELEAAVAARLPPAELAALLERVWASRQAEIAGAVKAFKTEAQQMRALISALDDGSANGTAATVDAVARAATTAATLEDLEFFVASVHNAEDFAAMGGLRAMARLMRAADERVAAGAAWVLGTAVKGAPALIDAALDEGALVTAAALLDAALARADAATAAAAADDGAAAAPALRVAAKALYAAGALARLSARGQRQLAALGGARALARALALGTARGGSDAGRALARKAANLVADLAQPLLDAAAAPSTSAATHDQQAALRLRVRAAAPGEDASGATVVEVVDGADAGADAAPAPVARPSAWRAELAADGDARAALCDALEAAAAASAGVVGDDELATARDLCGGAAA